MIFGVKHLVGGGKACLGKRFYVQAAYRHKSAKHIGRCVRVALVEHPLIPDTGRARLVGVNAGDYKDLILHLFLHLAQTHDIIEHGVLAVGGAGTDDKYKAVVITGEHAAYLGIVFRLFLFHLLGEGIHIHDLLGGGKSAFEFHIHNITSPFIYQNNVCAR